MNTMLSSTQKTLEATQTDLQKAISDRERQIEMEKKYRALIEKRDAVIRQKDEELKTRSVVPAKDFLAKMVLSLLVLKRGLNVNRRSSRQITRHWASSETN